MGKANGVSPVASPASRRKKQAAHKSSPLKLAGKAAAHQRSVQSQSGVNSSQRNIRQADDDVSADEEAQAMRRAFSSIRSTASSSSGSTSVVPALASKAKCCRRATCKMPPNPDNWGEYDTKMTKDGRVTKTPVGEVCGNCVSTYLKGGFELSGTLAQVIDLCNQDGETNRKFTLADRRRLGQDSILHVQNEVSKLLDTGMSVKVKLRGLTPAQFLSRFEKTPQQAKRKIRSLPHPSGANYKGVMVIDDGTLGGRGFHYSYKKSIKVGKKEYHMPHTEHLLENQAQELFDDLLLPSKDEDPEVFVCSVFKS